MKRTWILILAVAFLASCASQKMDEAAPTAAQQPPSAESISADEAAPELEAGKRDRKRVGLEDLVRTNNQFAFDLFKSMPPGNLLVSPHGVASALAVAYTGAQGETAEQIRATLRADISEKDIHQKFSQLHAELRKRDDPRGREATRGFRLRLVNGFWHDVSVDPTSRFLRIAHNKHFAEIAAADFQNAPEKSRTSINGFLGDATAGKLDDLLGPGRLTALTRIVIVDAAHFDAPWQVPFVRAQTRPRDFASPSGNRHVSTMAQRDRFAYLKGDGFSLVELPYAGGEVVATFIVPEGDVEAFGAGIDASYFQWMTNSARQTDVDVHLPKFELRTSHALEPVLSGMGMPDAFDPSRADFGGVTPLDAARPVYLDDVLHETWVSIDEDGTDAAATAAIRGGVSGAGGAAASEFHADKPFLFVVRDVPTGAILFIGRVVDP